MRKLELEGNFGEAIIYAVSDEKGAVDEYAIAQIKLLCDNEVAKNSKIRVMPDVHPAKVSTVGLTMTVGERILPNLVGTDIGCGVTMARLKKFRPEYQKIDKAIRENLRLMLTMMEVIMFVCIPATTKSPSGHTRYTTGSRFLTALWSQAPTSYT